MTSQELIKLLKTLNLNSHVNITNQVITTWGWTDDGRSYIEGDTTMTVGDLIEELQYLNPTLPVRIYKDGNIYDFTIDNDLIDRVDFNVMED